MGRKSNNQQRTSIIGVSTPYSNTITDYGTLAMTIATTLSDGNQNYMVKDYSVSDIFHTRFAKGDELDNCSAYAFDVDIIGSEINTIYIIDDVKHKYIGGNYFNGDNLICVIPIDFYICTKSSITIEQLADFFTMFRTRIVNAFSDNRYLKSAEYYNLAYFTTFAFINRKFNIDKKVYLEMQKSMVKPFCLIADDNKVYENLTALIKLQINSDLAIYRCMDDGADNAIPSDLLKIDYED